ncbi:hypothetical protein [Paenibacillus sp. MABNR03]|uniref:hypothetical protein n=1 Tax=Paenibacillus sp. MABNR03 TaxID=3142626 RepID=UPI003D280DCE
MKELKPEHPELEQQIIEMVEAGNVLDETQQHEQALIYYDQAWGMLPEPKTDWEIASWIASCHANAHMDLGQYALAKPWAEISLQTRGSDIDTGPLIELGTICMRLEQHDEAYSYLHRAYEYGKERSFQGCPPDVLHYYKEQKMKRERN